MIVVYLKFWIMILKVLFLNLEYKWEQFNDLHFSSKMKHMWNPDCDLAVWQLYDRLQSQNDADKSFQYGGTKMTSHGILGIQKSHFGHYLLHDLFHLRDRSLHYAPK